MHRSVRWTSVCSLLALALTLSGCFLMPKKKSGASAGASAGPLIDRTSIFMDRIGDGNTARLKFTAARSAICQMSFYSQDPAVPPTEAAPTAAPCAAGDPHTAFVESVNGLRADTLYYVNLTAWEPGSDAAHGDTVIVRETPTSSNVTNGANGAVIKDLMVAIFDLPLLTAEVHRAPLTQPTDVPTLRGQLTRVTGCLQGVPPKDAPFRDAEKAIGIQNLTTQDLAAGAASPHPDYPERLQLTYSALNQGLNQWTLLYQNTAGGTDVNVPVTPVAQISNIDMESTTIYNFVAPSLTTAPDPLALDPTKPLKFAWTTGSNLLDLSYMTVQIGRPGYNKGIYCVFPAAQRTGSVDAALLQNLDSGEHVVLAELASNLIWARDGWVVTTYDWRWGQIQK